MANAIASKIADALDADVVWMTSKPEKLTPVELAELEAALGDGFYSDDG